MLMLKLVGFGAFGCAALCVFALAQGWVFAVAALSLVATGTLFLAIDRIIELLSDIRARLPEPETGNSGKGEDPAFTGKLRTASEIAADIDRLRT